MADVKELLNKIQSKSVQKVEINTTPAAQQMIKNSTSNENKEEKVIKEETVESFADLNGSVDEISKKEEKSNKDDGGKKEEKSGKDNGKKKEGKKRGRKPTRTETTVKFSYKINEPLLIAVRSKLKRTGGRKVQPVLTKMIEDWIENPVIIEIDQVYTEIPSKEFKSTGIYIEQDLLNEFSAVCIENGTNMNQMVTAFYNEILRQN